MNGSQFTDREDPIRFAVRLRARCAARGLSAPTGGAIDLVRALVALGQPDPADCYFAARALFVRAPEDRLAFDAAFTAALAREDESAYSERRSETAALSPEQGQTEGAASPADGAVGISAYSAAELLAERNLADLTADERELVGQLVARLALHAARRRRTRRAAFGRSGDVLALRRSARSLRHPADPAGLRYRRRLFRPRRLVLLVDVSGSMAPYVPVYARLCYRLVQGRPSTEVFTLGTRLTRVTRALQSHDEQAAIAALTSTVVDWSGGTRLGESLKRFNHLYGVRGLARGATVVFFSDGLDRGDPELLGAEMHRLQFVAERIVWANPLKGTAGFAPLQRAMRAALPSIAHLVAGHSLAALSELCDLIGG